MTLLFADRDIEMYERDCPDCGTRLRWAVQWPPIPKTFYFWFDQDGERTLEFCPECDCELPGGDLR